MKFQKFQMNNAIYADPAQNLCLTEWLEFTLAACHYKLVYEIKCDAPIRSHHDYKEIWTPQKDDILYCKKNYRSESLHIDKRAVCIYKENRLVGNVPIELSRIIS